MPDLIILHTNDLHGKLTDNLAERIAAEKTGENVLLLDAGDAVASGNIYYRPWGEPILARMSEIGYNAMAMGNREFHFLGPGLQSKVKLARFPILSANLHSKPSFRGSSVVSSVGFEVNGIKVAVFGLTVPMITKRMKVSKASPFWLEDPVETARQIVPELRSQADLVVALTHIGLQADVELAGAVDGIDLIVGGHTHAILHKPQVVGRTSVVQTGSWGRYLGRVEVTMSEEGPIIRGTLLEIS